MMRPMITNETVNQAIDYILLHAEEGIRLEDVAEYCHFSKYYFCRLFKAQTGESVYGFIKRVRIEQSAFRLKTESGRLITEISADYGYSSSNYSSAFKLHYHMSPAVFRKRCCFLRKEHPVFRHENWNTESFQECRKKITMEDVKDYHVIYERRFGSYGKLCRDWGRFLEQYRDYVTQDTKFLERTYDDPEVTKAENCLYDICMSVEKGCPLENTATIRGGRCAVYHFNGHVTEIYAAYQTIFMVWLPRTCYQVDPERNLFDIYHRADCAAMNMELDICVPVK